MNIKRVTGCAVAALVVASGAAFGQWTTDIDANTVVSALTGDQGTPLSAAGPDGTTWIFHTDNSSGTYKHSLQRLDASGALTFSPPVDVSPTRVNSATFTVDLYADNVGNAYMAYDQAGALYVQKVNSAGVKQWGANGVLLPNSNGNLAPQVVGFDDGSAVVAWGATVNLRFQRINSDGTLGAAWAFTETGRAQVASDMVAAAGTEFISLWVRAEGTNSVTSRKGLKIQKWSASNTGMWNGGVPLDVYTSSATPARGLTTAYFPRIISDGSNGAIIPFYDGGATRNARIQHVRSDGTFVFPADGIECSNVSGTIEYRLSASAVYNAATQEYTIAYERTNPAQGPRGLNVQRVTAEGTLLWGGGSGIEVIPFNSPPQAGVQVVPGPNGSAILSWLRYTGANGPMAVSAARVNADGTFAWPTQTIDLASAANNKSRSSIVKSTTGDWYVAVWANDTGGERDVRAMRVNADGSLGAPVGCDSIDFNGNSVFPEDQDVVDFFDVLAGGTCPTGTCSDIDFNNNGVFPEDQDVVDFFNVLAGGNCP